MVAFEVRMLTFSSVLVLCDRHEEAQKFSTVRLRVSKLYRVQSIPRPRMDSMGHTRQSKHRPNHCFHGVS